MKNCVNCGQQISKVETICPYCGAAQEERTVLINEMNTQQPVMNQQQMNPQMEYGGQNVQPGYGQQSYGQPQQGYGQPQGQPGAKKPVNGKKIGIIAGIAVALVLVIVLVTKFIGPGAPTQKAAIKSYIKALVDEDADDYLDACLPKKLQKGVEKKYENLYGFIDDDFEEEIEYRMYWYSASWYDYIDDSDDVRKIKIVDKEKMDRSDIKDFQDEIEDTYKVKIKVTKLVYVEFECEVKEDGKWETETDTAILYKTGGKWFVMGDVFY